MFGFNSFSETPFSALALNQYQLVCESGSFSLNGQSANFAYNKAVNGNAGSYTLTGGSATFLHNQIIYAGAFNFQWTGNNASLNVSNKLYAEAGSFVLTGQAASLAQTHILECDAGSFAITGNNAEFFQSKGMAGETGSYLFFGQNAELNYTPIPVVVVESKGGIGKKQHKKHQEEKRSREELEAIVKREFDILDGTYVPEVVEVAKQQILPQIKEIDYTQYAIAIAQVNALLLQAKIAAAEYQAELDDEEALLMLL